MPATAFSARDSEKLDPGDDAGVHRNRVHSGADADRAIAG